MQAGQIGLGSAVGVPPAQRLASAFLVFPYIVSDTNTDTRITLVNMTNDEQSLSCFYVRQSDCVEIGFFVRLTAQQPLSWLASEGTSNVLNFTAVPPFDGTGELKCAAMPRLPALSYHNVAQGRAIVFGRDDNQTVAYGGIGFRRLVPGAFTGVISLDGATYEQCPDRLHFQVLARQGGSSSTLVTVPCEQDLYTQVPTETTVQLAIISEFEQVFSSSYRFSCYDTRSFSQISTLSKSLLGSDTAHVVARGVHSPIIGMVIDRFEGIDSHTAANNPFLEGGRSSTVFFP